MTEQGYVVISAYTGNRPSSFMWFAKKPAGHCIEATRKAAGRSGFIYTIGDKNITVEKGLITGYDTKNGNETRPNRQANEAVSPGVE